MKARLPMRGRLGGVLVDTKATNGAVVGVNLFWSDGTLVKVSDFGTAPASGSPNSAVSRTLWSLVAQIPPNVSAVAALATDGFVRRTGAAWTASPIVNADLSGANTTGLTEGTNLYYTNTRADGRVTAGIATHVALPDPHAQYALESSLGSAAYASTAAFDAAGAASAAQTAAQSYADAKVEDAIVDGVATKAPSQNAVFDALAGKFDKTGGAISGAATVAGDFTVGTTAGGSVFTVLRPGTTPAGSSLQLSSPATVIGFVGRTGTTSRCDLRFGANVMQLCVAVSDSTPSVQIEAIPTAVRPGGDNTFNFGDAGRRWKEIFCANSTINTSDAREKTEPRDLTPVEFAAATDLARLPCIFQWLSAIAEKGDAARLHCSPTVQAVIGAMQAHGLDPFRYGFVCYDQWAETVEPAEYDEEGVETRAAITHPAGDRYSLRPTELQHFILRGLEARLTAAGL